MSSICVDRYGLTDRQLFYLGPRAMLHRLVMVHHRGGTPGTLPECRKRRKECGGAEGRHQLHGKGGKVADKVDKG